MNMEKSFYKVAFIIIAVLGTVMAVVKSILYNESMNDWLSLVSMTSGVMLVIKSKSEKKISHAFQGILFIILAIVFMLRYLIINHTIIL